MVHYVNNKKILVFYIMPSWRSNPDFYRKRALENQKKYNKNIYKKISINLNQRKRGVYRPSWRANPDAYNKWRLDNKTN
jgi:hypothetical protein